MLQFGRFARDVPTDPTKNVAFRKNLLLLAEESESYRQALLHACKVDPWFFVNAFGWQTNPRIVFDEDGPFILWPKQAEAVERVIRRWLAGRSACIRKSRYQGGTWLSLFVQDWFCLFHENKTFIDISHTAKAVDNSHDPNSLFWKIDFIHRHLPDWMRRGAHHPAEAQMVYPATRGYVSGYATTKRAGVGGRATGVLSDEHGLQQDGKKIRANTATIGPRLFVSAFYDSKGDFLDVSQSPDYEQIDLHWTMNPLCNPGTYHFDPAKNDVVRHDDYQFPDDYPFVREVKPPGGFAPGVRSPWYDAMCREIGNDRDVACQLDMDPTGASNLVFEQDVIAACKRKAADRFPTFVGDLLYDPITAKPLGLQANAKGSLRLWLELGPDGRPPPLAYKGGADVAWGNAGPMATPSCATFVNQFGEKVAEYVSARIEPTPFAHYYVALARFFHDAEIAWECPGPGTKVSTAVVNLGYLNFFWKKSREGAVWSEKETDIPGWWNNPGGKEKTALLKDYAAALKSGEFLNPSVIALDECLQFVWVAGGKAEHNNERNKDDPSEAGANHGDRCFVAGTAIRTAEGDRPVECVTAGDWVLTRRGYRRVSVSGCSGEGVAWEAELSSGRRLIGTAEHPVWTENRGWVQLSLLTPTDRLLGCRELTRLSRVPRRSSLTASGITATPTRRTSTFAGTFGRTPEILGRRSRFTSPFGFTTTDPFLAENSSTTLTRTRLTTTSRTLPVSLGPNTANFTAPVAGWTGFVIRSSTATSASGAARSIGRFGSDGRSSAGPFVGRPIFAIAVKPLVGRRPVYNLSVEGCPEYFAEGVLVHNCIADALAFLMVKPILRRRDEPPKKKPEIDYYGTNQGLQLYIEMQNRKNSGRSWVKI